MRSFFVILIRSLVTSLGGGLSRRGGHLHEDGRRCGAPRTAHLPEAAAALSAQADALDGQHLAQLRPEPLHNAECTGKSYNQDAQQDGFREGLPDREGQESAALLAQSEAASSGAGTAGAAAGPQHGAA